MARKLRFILSLDGGGIRGLVPALVLQELERLLAEDGAEEPLYACFDMIAGTSAGGILAAGLAAPHPSKELRRAACRASDLVELYSKEGPVIFRRSFYTRLRSLNGLAGPRYSAQALEETLKMRIGVETKISDSLTHLVLPAYNMASQKGIFITNGCCDDGLPSDDYLLWQAARATSAAPTYFPPALVRNLTKNRDEPLIDGAVFANDPVLAALVEGYKLGWRLQDMVVLALGTGLRTRSYTYRQIKSWGPLAWISPSKGSPIIAAFMQGQGSTASYQARHLLAAIAKNAEEPAPIRYLRLDRPLDNVNDDLDDASPANIAEIHAFSEALIAEYQEQLKAFARLMADEFERTKSEPEGENHCCNN